MIMEACIFGLTAAFDNQSGGIRYMRLSLGFIRLCGILVLVGLTSFLLWPRKLQILRNEDRQPLLVNPGSALDAFKHGQVQEAAGYGSIDQSHDPEASPDDD
jgi:hypothetical protein